MNILLSILLFFSVLIPWDNGLQEEIAVIVHNSVKTETIDPKRLLDIYTLNFQSWNDGKRIQIADFKGDSDLRSKFYSHINLDAQDIKRVWLRKQFSGKSLPPSTVRDEDEMIQLVISKPGTIGYVSKSKVPEGAKIVMLIQ